MPDTEALPTAPAAPRWQCLLLTGAAGQLGRFLRPRLRRYCQRLRVSDQAELGLAAEGEEVVRAELQDAAAVLALLQDVNAVVHLGGVSTERSWESIRDANIDGMVNLYEAARLRGVQRIVFASSNHVTGMYARAERISPADRPRPDGFYGLSKAFGENLAQLYWDRHGIQTVSLRIGTALPEPTNRRMLSTWLSLEDLERLVLAALSAPMVGHTVMYGVSRNTSGWWDNRAASHIGFDAHHSADDHIAAVQSRESVVDAGSLPSQLQGGDFVIQGPYFDPPRGT